MLTQPHKPYVPPCVEVLKLNTECGFAASTGADLTITTPGFFSGETDWTSL